jgi:protein arginine N-methyltransferase 5
MFIPQGITSYRQYLDHLHQKNVSFDSIDYFAKGYNDYLQNPLQPLMDNLDSYTYEVFEKDPIKYSKYEEAIASALTDKVPQEIKDDMKIVVMVVGAGRGPLVQATLNASDKTGRNVKVYAVEKNPGAVVTLRNRQRDEWGDAVTVVSVDMREWEAPEKADILVSELLGSFGDNELSPECLDGAQIYLKDDGISIPAAYNSYLVPISAPKLYASIEDCKEKDKQGLSHYETPYVVRLWNANALSKTKKCFTFTHPKTNIMKSNDRYAALVFQNGDVPSIIHGFAGYFDAVLYKDVEISILPETHTSGMFSWFPIFFPLKKPIYATTECSIEINIWRCCYLKKVWYEWALVQPETTVIHNSGGKSYWIGL